MFGGGTVCIILLVVWYFCKLSSCSCIMEGPCEEDSFGDVNCARESVPAPLQDSSAIRVFRDMCPFMARKRRVCCSNRQVQRLKTIFQLPGSMMSRCPSCFENFKRIFCSFACAPNQSSFLNITRVENNNASQSLVREITYFIEDEEATCFYESCKKVQFSLGGTIMSVLCGPYGEKDCSPHNLLNYMGSDKNHGGLNPFHINFRFLRPSEKLIRDGNRTFRGMSERMTTCDSPDGANATACSCSDCEASCETERPPPFHSKEETWKIFGYDAMVFLLVFCSCFLVSVLAVILVIRLFRHIGYPPPRSCIVRAGSRCLRCLSNFLQVFVYLEIVGNIFEGKLKSVFTSWGILVTRHPVLVMFLSFLVSLVCSMGLWYFQVTTDPVDLWVSADSAARQDRDYFNRHFKPFYRTQQIIVVPNDQSSFTSRTPNADGGHLWGPVFRQEFLLEVQKLQRRVESIVAEMQDGHRRVPIEDICLSPLRHGCLVQSILAYYSSSSSPLSSRDYLKHFNRCVNDLSDESCYGEYGGPLIPVKVALGDMESNGNHSAKLYTAKALVITFPMSNHLGKKRNAAAMEWEKAFLSFMSDFKHENMSVAYRAERSVEDELSRGSESDKLVVGLSYLILFLYISLTLGDIRSCSHVMTDTKISLAVIGVFVVFQSMTASVGLFCYCGVPASLIVIQVLPFLVLAVGVDNVFLLVHTFQNDLRQPDESIDAQIGRVIGEIAPSMLLSSGSMSACFFIGAISPMPVIRTFALYAGVSLVINFFLQMTAFLAAFCLDVKRQEQNRWDLCWCVVSSKIMSLPGIPRRSLLTRFFRNVYAPFLMKRWVRIVVLLIFILNLLFSLSTIYTLEVGFEEKDAMPVDSYLQNYFEYLNLYLSFGPPVYFIISDGYNYSNPLAQRKLCGKAGCDHNSVVSILTQMSRSNWTFIASPPSSWIDDYIAFMRTGSCCKVYKKTGTYCPSSHVDTNKSDCQPCFDPPSVPTRGDDFYKYLSFFLQDVPSQLCPVAGRALHREAVVTLKRPDHIGPTYFMTYHTSLKTSRDNILALQYSRYIAKRLEEKLGENGTSRVKVIPYSLPHVFYEQYLTIWSDTLRGLSFSLVAIFVVVFIFMGLDLFSATIVTITIIMIVASVMGTMFWWKIPLNAVSLVNLVVAVGISVEFCSHLALAFSVSYLPTRADRAREAIGTLGRSIVSGITLTDSGVLLLAFAKLPVFSVYYFRMYLAIILFGTVHSIVFLPVLLSWVGPPVKRIGKDVTQPTASHQVTS